MRTLQKFLFTMFAVCSLCTLATAANVTVLNAKPSQCAALPSLLEDLKAVNFPADWTVYVTCDAGTFQDVLRRADVRLTDAALTSREKRFTIINGAMYSPTFSFANYTQKTPLRVLKHETGHINCNTHNEDVADHYADTGACR